MTNENIKIEIKSPIHIGTGNKITKLDYLMEGRNVVVYSIDKLLSNLDEKTLNEVIINLEKGRKINEALVRKYLNKIEKYRVKSNVKELNQNKEIHEFIKIINEKQYKPYIPASELKGAIRTAILYKILKDNWNELKNIIVYEKNKIIFLKGNAIKTLENKVFGNIKADIMKFFLVKDIEPFLQSDLSIEEIKIINSRRNFSEYTECLVNGSSIFDVKILKENPEFKKHRYREYLINWKECCFEYTKDLIIVEKDYWKNRNQEIFKFLENLEKQNTKENPLLRLGRFTGKLSHTIVILLKTKNLNVDKKVFPKTRRITGENEVLGWIKI